MTKEDLLVWSDSSMDCYSKANLMTSKILEFFDSNVCIPKGTNRHPDAEILHQYIENCTEDFKLIQFDDALDDWFATDVTSEMRFKVAPSEPVWEYQYACVDEDGKGYITGFYAPSIEGIPSDGILLEDTKRIREV